ncbi:hypothetical protein [Limnohabitans sp. Rim28]|uniref:hypothetical protein n=1 Tax=Limnohabitans sp. Rim28 TaxID=1100720 RepID=UPI0010571017|nr:hypothetical protein [Limnohabitans sp. Rim28]
MTAPNRTPPPTPRAEPSPMAVIGAILAQGAIRLLDRQKREAQLANRTEESVHAGVLTTKDNTHE